MFIIKHVKKFFAIILTISLALSANILAFSAFNAPKLTRNEWDMIYSSNFPYNNLPMLCVGADETQVSLCWHSEKSNALPSVRLSEYPDMSEFKEINGKTTDAEKDTQVVCRVTIAGLKENTTYYYQWFTGTEWSKICKYETKSFGNHKALVVGDIQITEDWITDGETQSDTGFNWNNVLAEALSQNPDISYLVSPGDNTSTGKTDAEFKGETQLYDIELSKIVLKLVTEDSERILSSLLLLFSISVPRLYELSVIQ